MAFSTTTGHYQYRVMLYGLAEALSVFQCFINVELREMLGRFVIAYIDDILIFSKSYQEHVNHMKEVLSKLWDNQLYVKGEKCEFHVTTVRFLGYIISQEGVKMGESRVKVIREWQKPRTVKELQRFLGFANFYQRFIRGFSNIAAPLTSMLKKGARSLSWNRAADTAFNNLKTAFTSTPILKHPDPERPFIAKVDASNTGVGAVLSQHFGEKPKLHPIAFFSRKLSSAEQNYNVGDRELLSIKLALEEWRHWLEGAIHPFVILTDHKNLEYLQTARRHNSRQARWALFFTRFKFTVSSRVKKCQG